MLVVEDGTIVANANSYASLVEIRDYALQRGVILSTEDTVLEALAIKAMDYIEAYRDQFKGAKVSSLQELQWPRVAVFIDGFEIPQTTIPREVKALQCQLCIEQFNEIDILPTDNEPFIVKEKVGVLETVYSDKVNVSSVPTMPSVDNLLRALCYWRGTFSTVRI